MPDVRIREAGVNELGLLLRWREEVLRCVFSLPENADTSALMQANEAYYRSAVPSGKHIACFAQKGGETIGCALERNITKIYLETSPCGRALYEAAGFSEMRDMMLLTYGK